MKLEQVKDILTTSEKIAFQLPDGRLVPAHFHVTEVGKITRHFIDCGGTERMETIVNFQLWEEKDYNHRLHPEKLLKIIELSQSKLGIGNLDIEVEYQSDTIGKYGLDHDGNNFLLTAKTTACLAKEGCLVPDTKKKVELSSLITNNNSCAPGSGCC